MLVGTVVLATIAAVLLVLRIVRWRRHVRLINTFPGREPHPIAGNLLQMGEPTSVAALDYIKSCTADFKRAYRNWVGPWSLVCLVHPESIKQVLSRDTPKAWNYRFFEAFLGRYNLFAQWRSDSSELHHKLRKIHTPMFHFSKLRVYQADYNAATQTLLEKWDKRKGEPIELESEMGLLSLDVILRSALGYISECQNKEVPYLAHVKALTGNLMDRTFNAAHWTDFAYSRTQKGKENAAHASAVMDFGLALIHKRREAMAQARREGSLTPENAARHALTQDYIGQFIQYANETHELTDEEIVSAVQGIVFAAHDTTGCVLAFTMHTLARFPDLQERVRAEVLKSIGYDVPTYDDLAQFSYMQMFVEEVMRLYPPGPLLGRTLDDDAVVEGRKLPKGQWLEIGVYGLHHNPEVWPEPEKFDPERFSAKNKHGRHAYSFLPFSAGNRGCLGQKFAMFEMKTVLSQILQRYTVLPAPDSPAPTVISHVVLHATTPLKIILEPRNCGDGADGLRHRNPRTGIAG